jgi:hypothetical protein
MQGSADLFGSAWENPNAQPLQAIKDCDPADQKLSPDGKTP